jgi:hypothetical protein
VAAIVFGVLAAVIIGLVIYSAVTKKTSGVPTSVASRDDIMGGNKGSGYGSTGAGGDEIHPLLRPSGGRV